MHSTPTLSLVAFLAAVAAYLLLPPGTLLAWTITLPLCVLVAVAVAWR